MISLIITIIKLLIILCLVATIHEFGHFIIAKLFKMGVDEFSECNISEINPADYFGVYNRLVSQQLDRLGTIKKQENNLGE